MYHDRKCFSISFDINYNCSKVAYNISPIIDIVFIFINWGENLTEY